MERIEPHVTTAVSYTHLTETVDKFDVLVNVRGGGYTGQAAAIRHGIARALLQVDSEYRPVLKSAGFLTSMIPRSGSFIPGLRFHTFLPHRAIISPI